MKMFVRTHDWYPIYTLHAESEREETDVGLDIPETEVARLKAAAEEFLAAHQTIVWRMMEHENKRETELVEVLDGLGLRIV